MGADMMAAIIFENGMANRAVDIVADYISIVWQCKTLQNWKFLLSSSLPDGMYYELTYNGNKQEWYLDAYKKFENRCIEED